MRRILVTGSRDFPDHLSYTIKQAIREAMISEDPSDHILIEGQCPYGGADQLAQQIALNMTMPVISVPANWAKYGKQAGPIRNEFMLSKFNPDIVLAFPRGKSTRGGTRHCINLAKTRGIEVREFNYEW